MHTLLRRSLAVVSVRDEVGTVGRALVRHHIISCHDLQILVLGRHVLVLDHNLTNRGLLREIEFVDALLE